MKQDKLPIPGFTPVNLRARHDGWTAEKQMAFIAALAETACVEEACASVGMGRTSAYALRARSDAESFRIAWEASLAMGIGRLTDAVIGRALNGTSRPVFYKGEVVGERRYFDERLAMFLLRSRQPARFGEWVDGTNHHRGPDNAADSLTRAVHNLMLDPATDDLGMPQSPHASIRLTRTVDEAEQADERAARKSTDKGGT